MHAARHFFGSDLMTFSVHSNAVGAGPDRTYHRFTDVLHDTIDARVFLGIHFRTPDVQGAGLGKEVADWLAGHFFRRTGH